MTVSQEIGDIIVRLAEYTDAAQLASLNRAFNESDISVQQIADYLANCPNHEKTVVVDVEGELAGFACLQVYRSWCYADPCAELTELFVKPEYRRRGFGQAMVSSLETIARDAGATEIVLLTNQLNITAHSLYRGCGYIEQPNCSFRKILLTP